MPTGRSSAPCAKKISANPLHLLPYCEWGRGKCPQSGNPGQAPIARLLSQKKVTRLKTEWSLNNRERAQGGHQQG